MPDRWEFSNDCFRKDEKRLLCEITRRKISAAVIAPPPAKAMLSPSNSSEEQVMSSTSSPGRGPAELVDENEKLRRENLQLTKELAEMKSLCSNIFSMVSGFASVQCDSGFRESKPLDLMPQPPPATALAQVSPRLFGVAIGTKRAREDQDERQRQEEKQNDCVASASASAEDNSDGDGEKEMDLKLRQPNGVSLKSEPLDVDHQEKPWLKNCHRANQRVCN